MSFSRWIFEYVFEPLQMKFRNYGKGGIAAALLVTFILAGLWHGASWTFILFGLTHGIYLSVEFVYKPYRKKLYKLLGVEKSRWLKWWQIFITFNLVSFAFVFFRANSLGDAWYVITNLSFNISRLRSDIILSQGIRPLLLLLICITLMVIAAIRPQVAEWFKGLFYGRGKWLLYYLFVMFILICGLFDNSEFIYGRF